MTSKERSGIAIQPHFHRVSQAPAYLGMCRREFNDTVRPHVREVRIGKQGIAFDRYELDEWADRYLEEHAIKKPTIGQPARPTLRRDQLRLRFTRPWRELKLRRL